MKHLCMSRPRSSGAIYFKISSRQIQTISVHRCLVEVRFFEDEVSGLLIDLYHVRIRNPTMRPRFTIPLAAATSTLGLPTMWPARRMPVRIGTQTAHAVLEQMVSLLIPAREGSAGARYPLSAYRHRLAAPPCGRRAARPRHLLPRRSESSPVAAVRPIPNGMGYLNCLAVGQARQDRPGIAG